MAESYKIKKGDTLWDIAKRIYGDGRRYKELAEFNNIANPNMIIAGKTLQIPSNEAKVEPKKEYTPPASISGDFSLDSAPAREQSYDITPNSVKPYLSNSSEVIRRELPMDAEEAPQTVLPKNYYKRDVVQRPNTKNDYQDISDSEEYKNFMAELEAEEEDKYYRDNNISNFYDINPVDGGIVEGASVEGIRGKNSNPLWRIMTPAQFDERVKKVKANAKDARARKGLYKKHSFTPSYRLGFGNAGRSH